MLRVEHLSLDIPGRRLLDDISIHLRPGETLAVMGPSGSGKTSLLNCLAGIIRPTSGRVWLREEELTFLSPARRAAVRLANVGCVFQFGELLPELSIVENVALPLRLRGVTSNEARSRAERRLEAVGLKERAADSPEILSGGEVQRVALARATVAEPCLILADEPTGSLDEHNAAVVCDLIYGQATQLGAAVVVATHNPDVARRADGVSTLRNGRLEGRSLVATVR